MATLLGRFTAKRVDELTLKGTFESLHDRNVGDDPGRKHLSLILLDLWGNLGSDGLDADIAAIYEAESADFYGTASRPEGVNPLWYHVVGGSFDHPGAATTTWSLGVEDPRLLNLIAVGMSFSWESYILG